MILSLAGKKHSGKGTTAALLVKELGFVELSFAGPLKDFTAEMLGVPRWWMDDESMKESVVALFGPHANELQAAGFMTFKSLAAMRPFVAILRWFLQQAGNAARKVFGADFWIKQVLARTELAHAYVPNPFGDDDQCSLHRGGDYCWAPREKHTPHVVISDCRYFNEVKAIRAAGGRVVRLNRADRTGRHEFCRPMRGIGCVFVYSGGALCGRPERSHPTSWSEDRHLSEVELPDDNPRGEGHDPRFYHHVIESPSAEETARLVLGRVRSWV